MAHRRPGVAMVRKNVALPSRYEHEPECKQSSRRDHDSISVNLKHAVLKSTTGTTGANQHNYIISTLNKNTLFS